MRELSAQNAKTMQVEVGNRPSYKEDPSRSGCTRYTNVGQMIDDENRLVSRVGS